MLNQKLNSEISETKTHFELIFKTIPDASLISRLDDGRIMDFNETFTQVTGFTKEDISGTSTLDLQIWKNPNERSEVIKILNECGSCENRELMFQRKGGEEFTGLFSAKIISLSGVPHILSVTRDITQRKLAEEEIRIKNEELKRINIEKDKLFSVIAHDLRNPFTTFMGYSEMMVNDLPGMSMEEIHNIAVSLKNSSTNLFGLLENLLDWSREEQGMIRFNPENLQLLPLIKESLSRLSDTAKVKDIELTCSIPEAYIVYADKNILQSVIRNLVSNAIKFTSEGGKVTISSINKSETFVEISVKDSGIGMTREMIENLFKLDSQANRAGTKGEPSTGLGLILCKGFIEKHGGQINIESVEGKGTVFHFTIPSRD
jgi:PAS domain S-box-containing protein